MTVWAKLQSWLGASASDVAIDNEFNNIYLGLNEAANGNLPSGYNKVDLTFTGASLTIKGETKIGNTNVPLDSTLTVSGAAGWRYIVTTNGGVMSVESIPPAEITADTQVYTPTPVFNSSANGYYSTVNTARRIVGVLYFSTTIKRVIPYGNSTNKNDDNWMSEFGGVYEAFTVGKRLQFTTAFTLANGSNISIADNGTGSSSGDGLTITANKNGKMSLFLGVAYDNLTLVGAVTVSLLKNDTEYCKILYDSTAIGGYARLGVNLITIPNIPVNKDDFFSVVVIASTGGYSGYVTQVNATFEEY